MGCSGRRALFAIFFLVPVAAYCVCFGLSARWLWFNHVNCDTDPTDTTDTPDTLCVFKEFIVVRELETLFLASKWTAVSTAALMVLSCVLVLTWACTGNVGVGTWGKGIGVLAGLCGIASFILFVSVFRDVFLSVIIHIPNSFIAVVVMVGASLWMLLQASIGLCMSERVSEQQQAQDPYAYPL